MHGLKQFGQLVLDWPTSLIAGYRQQNDFRPMKSFCFFIGHPRSGHSIVGALLDAHPEIVVAHELGVFKYLLAGFNRIQLFYLLHRNARLSAGNQRRSGNYEYAVPGSWQGRHRIIRVIGDKQGGGAVMRLRCRPRLLARLRRTVQLPLRCIHVVRHPLDNITTIHRKADLHGIGPQLINAVHYYFELCESIAGVRLNLVTNEVFDLRHEDFIENPRNQLQSLCTFLGVDAETEYLEACAGIIRPTPNKSREWTDWPAELIDRVIQRCCDFPFLTSYAEAGI